MLYYKPPDPKVDALKDIQISDGSMWRVWPQVLQHAPGLPWTTTKSQTTKTRREDEEELNWLLTSVPVAEGCWHQWQCGRGFRCGLGETDEGSVPSCSRMDSNAPFSSASCALDANAAYNTQEPARLELGKLDQHARHTAGGPHLFLSTASREGGGCLVALDRI